MNLHGQIMNLPCDISDQPLGFETAFKRGHRQARYAAAELALATDAELERLRAALRELWRTQDPDVWDAEFAAEVSEMCKA